ncbi:MAG: cupin domain-containing protein [Gemmatimonadaceae bacterium]
MTPVVESLIAHFKLVPLPAEGTLFASVWRSREEFPDGKPVGTSIVAMYSDDPPSMSRFHRLPVDEVWHFYSGDPLRLILLAPDGTDRDVIMGSDPLSGHQVQLVIPAGTWQAGHLVPGGRYALFGCTMAPGFTDDMFVGGTRDELLASHPSRRDDIDRLACDAGATHMPLGFAR